MRHLIVGGLLATLLALGWAHTSLAQSSRAQFGSVRYTPLRSVSFTNLNTSGSGLSAALASAASRLRGFYYGSRLVSQFNPVTNNYEYITHNDFYLFYADGRVYAGLPAHGAITTFAFARAQQTDPRDCGTYMIAGDRILFVYDNGAIHQTLSFARLANGAVRIGPATVFKVGTFDGLRLQDTYERQSYVATGEGSVSGVTTFAFGRDGRFVKKVFVGEVSGGGATHVASSAAGSYRISGNLLALSYNDGQTEAHTFFIVPGDEHQARPGALVIDGAVYLLQK